MLENDVFIDTFLWCPVAAYGDEARKRAGALAERAHLAYHVSEKTLARISECDKLDGLFSIAQLPMWEPQDVRLGESALIMVADGMEIPGNLGTLIRTLDAGGADCLVLTNRRGAVMRLLDGTGEFTAEVVPSASGQFRFFAAPGQWTIRALHQSGTGEASSPPTGQACSRSTSRCPERIQRAMPAVRGNGGVFGPRSTLDLNIWEGKGCFEGARSL